jgi:nucleoside-diphosphate-sugar epimerase
MQVFLAAATGAIGTRLVPWLARTGHTVTGTTRHRDKAEPRRCDGEKRQAIPRGRAHAQQDPPAVPGHREHRYEKKEGPLHEVWG